MKLLSPQQIHEWDAYTIEHEPIASIDLMERAARRCTDFIIEHNFKHQQILIFCGKGNNGGDGLAIARQLIEAGLSPVVYILEFGAKGTDDFQTNLHKLHQLTTAIHFIQAAEFFPVIDKHKDLVIDALFGSGLNRPLQELSAALVDHINNAGVTVIAIDVPSGMFIDKSSKDNIVIKAKYTLTFQALKLCFIVAENAPCFGEVHVLDIGLINSFLQTIKTYTLVTKQLITTQLIQRNAFAHKGTYGHALLIAGNKGKMGAAILAAKACLRSGAGLVTINTNENYFTAVHAALPEAMCIDRSENIDHSIYKSAGIGPGIGVNDESAIVVAATLTQFTKPMVIDADALNIIAANEGWLNNVPAGSIITPHPKEFERLFGKCADDFERIEKVMALSIQYPFTIVLKGHHTMIASKGEAWFNTTGNPGMAKGGSGDVLTGMLSALLAQGYDPLQSALTGVYLHGLAADIAIKNIAQVSMLATDIIDHISDAILSLQETDDTSLSF
ncbi:NAD(P)H-hydrate dehydratase [Panacibacter ginsenosidivorans]|uniref:Bifunctional NAD(P)H-hydrate repair enzyme n=1 Tax=Panacibacter ginsenosidivorans TaxID=1813871 RepID=A0A5B8V3G8_9BACT|nr:NAD(P)H-hydrate dehydratase [Panacibacter ginsenosidivorans]QEC66067.1 NAD(P)H-hydrate dehydratase [Panacibacter ginsenosidivorans]